MYNSEATQATQVEDPTMATKAPRKSTPAVKHDAMIEQQ